MPIMMDKVTVSKTAPAGTVVGTLTMLDETGTARKANYVLTEDAAGFFAISGASIVTLKTPIAAGFY